MPRIVMTGANGQVGRMLRPYFAEHYGGIVLSDRDPIEDPGPEDEVRPADLTDPAALAAALEGAEAVVHLGAKGLEGDWETVLRENIVGLHGLFEAARLTGVGRVIFASSVHAIGFYPRHRRIGVDDRVRPDSRYGVSKVFGEGLASLYADKHGLRTLSIRIGNANPKPIDLRRLSIWIHPEDLFQLCRIGIEHPDIHNQVVFGASDNARSWWDNSPAFALGYRPKHRSEDHAAAALAAERAPDPVGDRFQGGTFPSAEFDGDLERALWA